MNKKIVSLAALLLLAGFAAAAGTLTVKRQDTASLYAERYTISEALVLEDSGISPVPATLSAAGTLGSPVELTPTPSHARTALVQDHWMYSVLVKEAEKTAVGPGAQFTLELQVNGVTHSTLYIAQSAGDAAVVEGVRASFDLGTGIGSSSLYYVVARPYVPTGPTVAFTVRSNPNDNNTWLGVGAPIDTMVNPVLSAALGSTIQLTAKNEDGQLHNIGFKLSESATLPIDPPGWSENLGEGVTRVISFTPGAGGVYRYQCQYHPGMGGSISVA